MALLTKSVSQMVRQNASDILYMVDQYRYLSRDKRTRRLMVECARINAVGMVHLAGLDPSFFQRENVSRLSWKYLTQILEPEYSEGWINVQQRLKRLFDEILKQEISRAVEDAQARDLALELKWSPKQSRAEDIAQEMRELGYANY